MEYGRDVEQTAEEYGRDEEQDVEEYGRNVVLAVDLV